MKTEKEPKSVIGIILNTSSPWRLWEKWTCEAEVTVLSICAYTELPTKQVCISFLLMCDSDGQVRPTNQRFYRISNLAKNVTDTGISEAQVKAGRGLRCWGCALGLSFCRGHMLAAPEFRSSEGLMVYWTLDWKLLVNKASYSYVVY